MKNNRWMKVTCLLLVLCMMLTLAPLSASAAEETGEKQDVVDFVLLIDCSQTMSDNDPDDLVKEACELFVRLLPIEDARLSVIAFGYEGSAYQYTNFEVNKNKWYTDEAYVHVVSQMEGNLSVKRRDEISNAITGVGKNKGTLTPIGAALAAGVDTLLNSGSVDGQACIVLMTDGDRTSGELSEDARLTGEAVKTAASHEWPIYCIELDYWGNNDKAGSEARKLLNSIVVDSGAGAEGRKKVSDPDEVSKAFMDITNAFWGGNDIVEELILDANGERTKKIEVKPLTSELNISISGDNVSKVRVQSDVAGVDRTFTKSELVGEEGTMGNMIVTKEGSYTCIKLICPKSGTWTITVTGDPNAEIDWYAGSQMEMNLDMTARASVSGILTKNDYVDVSACFTYHGVDIMDEPAYMDLPAKLVVKNLDTGKVQTYDMNADKDGFSYSLKMSEAPGSGKLQLSVKIEHGMFRSGSVASGSSEFELENLLATLTNPGQTLTYNGNLNNNFEVIDLNTLVNNPDGDTLHFEFKCVSDRNVTFAFEPDENLYVTIPTGLVPGSYEMELVIWEDGMKADQYLVQPVMLVVENQGVAIETIPDQEVWVDYIPFLQPVPENLELDLDLDAYVSDPDGLGVTYSDLSCDQSEFADVRLDGSVIHVDPLDVGETTVMVTVSDGYDTKVIQVQVEVVSGIAIYVRDNWIYWAMTLAAIIIAFIAFKFVQGSTRVKGKWTVALNYRDEDNAIETPVDLGMMRTAKQAKHKAFKVKDLLSDCSPYFEDPDKASNLMLDFLKEDLVGGLKMKGVFGGNGFELLNIPASTDVKVQVGGKDVPAKTKKIRVASGNVRIAISTLDPMTGLVETLNIKLSG